MRIVRNDLKSLIFCCQVLGTIAEQTLDESKREALRIHQHRVRKVYSLLLCHIEQSMFDIHSLCQQGIDDDSTTARNVRIIAPLCDN